MRARFSPQRCDLARDLLAPVATSRGTDSRDGASAARSPRCRSSSAASLRAQHGMLFADPLRFGLRGFQLVAHGFEGQLRDRCARRLSARPASDSAARFSCARSSSRCSRSSSRRATEMRELERLISSAARRMIVIERNRFLLARLLQLAQPLQLRFKRARFLLQRFVALDLLQPARAPAPSTAPRTRAFRA